KMKLTERKEKIIEAVVGSYINACAPISSADIQKEYLPAISSATIRNELAALEEMGYLAQPHTSAGRIPTAEAYRLYVEKLMPRRKLTKSELEIVGRYFNRKLTELDDILKSTAKVISEITNLTGIAYVQNVETALIQSVKIVKITDTDALFIIVTDRGMLRDAAATMGADVSEEYFTRASEFATQVFRGRSVADAAHNAEKIADEVLIEYAQLFGTVFSILKSHALGEKVSDIVLEGSAKILEQPEYANLSKAKAMLELFDAKESLLPILSSGDEASLNVLISKDGELRPGTPECAIVTVNYAVNKSSVGKAGVIGPIRMDYGKVISVLDYIGKVMSALPEDGETDEAFEDEQSVANDE
ncbi:MAG: heat-inducible transcriptional repressor HrcA, partial [Firmicutes bacterium]|nr:heat-inducible transcriptional repressor HrcA [Bacillota bacterium]